MKVLAVSFSLACLASGSLAAPLRFVDIGPAGPAGTVRVAGRVVRDLAVADRVLVGVRPGVGTSAAAHRALGRFRGRVSRALGSGRILVVDLPPGSDILTVARRLRAEPGVEFAEPDRAVYTTLVPTDPEYLNQPHLPQIKAPQGWDIGTGSSSVIIAIVDSGIDLSHPDLAASVWTNADEFPGNGLDDDHNGYVDDVHGWDFYDDDNDVQARPVAGAQNEQVNHGTLTAGLAAAAANDWGTVGVTWNATIMPVKVFGHDGTTSVSTVIDGMYYAVNNGCDILNLSIGSGYEDSFTPPITQLWNRGGLTVSAAGNDSQQITDARSTWVSPTCNNGPRPLTDNMNLGVAGLDGSDRKASWSNWDGSTARTFVDVSAPGLNLHGPAVHYPSVPGFTGYFTNNSGTSFSAPLVSGLAALLKAQSPSRTGADLIRIIRESCDNIDSRNPGYVGKLGAGRINVARAMGADLPPAAPTGLAAADTPGDQGGSVTLTWIKSADDGAGTNLVTGYIVSRATGSLPGSGGGATWVDLVTLPKGTVLYRDETTIDGLDYYYRVAATDGSHRTESVAVGPVQSFDDSAPPRVESLVVQDHPGDSGGAIDLDWTGYPGAGDLSLFRVYRDSRPFTSVTGKTPLASVPNPAARTFTDTTTTDGADYYYAVTGLDSLGNERKDVRAVGPVQSFANGAIVLAPGLHLLGAPAIPLDQHPATLLGIAPSELRYARYNPATGAYEKYSGDPISDFLKLALGRGFWVELSHSTVVTPGGLTAPGGNFDVAIQTGWQHIANPFFAPFDFSLSTVTVGTNTMDLASADSLGIIRSYAWLYNSTAGDYQLVHPEFGSTTLIPPWRGLWVDALQPCTLTLVRPAGVSAATTARPRSAASGNPGWSVQLIARSAGSIDAANYFGVRARPLVVAAPPPVLGTVELSFSPDAAAQSTRSAVHVLGANQSRMQWPAEVSWTRPEGQIVVTWPDLSQVPGDLRLYLLDRDTGRRISMRHQQSYVIATGTSAGTRQLLIEASRDSGRGVQVSAMSVTPAASAAEVVFTLSCPAVCEITILNMAGRPVRVIEAGRDRPSGVNVVAWDGRSGAGTRVPAGQYLVRLLAQSDDGTRASALRSVRLSR